jgi:flagellar hook-basal body complex protein FliE
MSIKALDAAAAYGASLTRGVGTAGLANGDSIGATNSASPVAGASFADLLGQSFTGAVDATKSAEQASFGAVNKTSDLVDVVSAVNNAELALETVVAVRDKMISAYQDIMRMPI